MKVTSIKPLGRKQTYSLSMKNEPHNYVMANGAVSKNSHAYGYGLISYQTAWLKTNYPIYYMSALLTTAQTQDKIQVYLNECRSMGIEVTVPDVNVSTSDFRPVDGRIAFGLASVKNLGEDWANGVTEAREKEGKFKSFQDFCNRVDPTMLNSKFIETAIDAGAFDAIAPNRKGLSGVSKKITKSVLKHRKVEDAGQMGLFSGDEAAAFETIHVPDMEYDYLDRLLREKELLGVFVSDSPLYSFEEELKEATDASIHGIVDSGDGSTHTIGGFVSGLRRLYTKKGDAMATFILEDFEGQVEVVVFPAAMKKYGHLINEDSIVTVTGRYAVERREDANFVCQRFEVLAGGESSTEEYVVRLPAAADSRKLTAVKKVLASHPGPTDVVLDMDGKRIKLPDDFRVDASLKLDVDLAAALRK